MGLHKIEKFDFSKRMTTKRQVQFAEYLKGIAAQIGFKVSARGWCYVLETERLIDKSEFDKAENAINKCRKNGLLPVDFIAGDSARAFKGVEYPSTSHPAENFKSWLLASRDSWKYVTPDWWKGEKYYIQMIVEKVDLVTLFAPVCSEYHIPIANAKGWPSVLIRAEYAKRFKDAEAQGLQPVLLYCGDHDPDGLRISDFLRKNLEDVSQVVWSSGRTGYDPSNLIIERFGLNADLIEELGLVWIDNLETGSKKDLASPSHPNHFEPYVQNYINTHGARKCEANAIVTKPDAAADLCRRTIESYLGKDALSRFADRRQEVKDKMDEFGEGDVYDSLDSLIELVDEELENL